MSTLNTVLQTKSDSNGHFNDEPLGQKTNAIRWLQKQVMRKSAALPRDFSTKEAWETFRTRMRRDLPSLTSLRCDHPDVLVTAARRKKCNLAPIRRKARVEILCLTRRDSSGRTAGNRTNPDVPVTAAIGIVNNFLAVRRK